MDRLLKWFLLLSLSMMMSCRQRCPILENMGSFTPDGLKGVSIRIIGRDNSLKPILRLLDSYPADKIAVFFDIDGTISNNEPGANWSTPNRALRGGSETREVFQILDQRGIRWFAVSAAASSINSTKDKARLLFDIVSVKVPNFALGIDSCRNKKGSGWAYNPKEFSQSFRGQRYVMTLCDNLIAARLPNDSMAWEKHVAIEYAIEHFLSNPKLILFIDDQAKNVFRVYEHFKRAKKPDLEFVSILYSPHSEDSDHCGFLEKVLMEMRSEGIDSK